MTRSHADAPTSVAGRVRGATGWWWRAITGNPAGVAVSFVAWLVGFLGSMFVLQSFLWDVLVADVATKLPESVTGDPSLIVATPFDVIVVQIQASAIVGFLLATAATTYVARGWLGRRREDADAPLARGTVLQAALLVLAVVALAVGLSSEYLVPWLFAAVEASEVFGVIGPSSWVPRWLTYVLLVGLALGLSAVAPVLTAALASAGVVRSKTIVGDATQVGLVLAAFGLVFWPVTPLAQALWLGPLLASLALSVGLCRVVAGGDGSRPVP